MMRKVKIDWWARRASVLATMLLTAGLVGLLVASPVAAQPAEAPPVTEAVPENQDAAAEAPAAAEARAEGEVEMEAEADAAPDANVDAEADATADANAAPRTDANVDANVDANAAPRTDANVDANVDANAAPDANVRAGSRARAVGSAGNQLGARLSASDGILRINNVTSDSVAARAGLQARDEIISINGLAVASEAEFDNRWRAAEADGRVQLQYRRNGQLHDTWVDVAPRSPSDESGRQEQFFRGPDQSPRQRNGAVQRGDYYYDSGTTHCGGHHRRNGHHRHGHHRNVRVRR